MIFKDKCTADIRNDLPDEVVGAEVKHRTHLVSFVLISNLKVEAKFVTRDNRIQATNTVVPQRKDVPELAGDRAGGAVDPHPVPEEGREGGGEGVIKVTHSHS